MLRFLLLLLAVSAWSPTVRAEEPPPSAEDLEHYERKIRPLLAEHCYACHSASAKTLHGGLRLDSSSALSRGGDSGPAVDRQAWSGSLLLEAVRYEGDLQMPPEGKLPAAAIAELTRWVERGAPMPVDTEDSPRRGPIDWDEARDFWAFQPAVPQQPPAVGDPAWPRTRIDRFVLAAMEREGLAPAPEADRATLIRRLSFDLIGLPPSPEEVMRFVEDPSPRAYEDLVERLLQSPRYGEKWARHWLDLARYTDKTASWLESTGQAHLYRDWVVRAFNEDMPYDQFVQRQLATDLMDSTGPEDLPALGFLSLSPTYWKELKLPCEIIKTIVADEWEERVDAVSRTFLGLTVACARCHDHKFDPITSADYYALAGVFASCRPAELPMIPAAEFEPVRQARQQVAELTESLEKLKKQQPPPDAEIQELTRRIAEIQTQTPRYHTPMANGLVEESLHVERAGATPQDGTRLEYRAEPRDLPLFIRGNPNRPGDLVRRRFLTVLSRERDAEDQPRPFQQGSGRLELARAITGEAASLAARVAVNRVWLAHFGRGLVATPSNFGTQGDPPSHPELLDDLAARFLQDGWSIKQLHREILLSAAWRQSSAFDAAKVEADPANRWLSRMNRRKLDFEAWRDAMLQASGRLDLSVGGPALDVADPNNLRRTLYALVHRREMSTTLTVHDFPDPAQHSPARSSTITPLQGLFALNGPLLAQQAVLLRSRLQQESLASDPAAIERAHWLLFSRPPSHAERQSGLRFLGDAVGPEREERWSQYLHVLLASNELLFVD